MSTIKGPLIRLILTVAHIYLNSSPSQARTYEGGNMNHPCLGQYIQVTITQNGQGEPKGPVEGDLPFRRSRRVFTCAEFQKQGAAKEIPI